MSSTAHADTVAIAPGPSLIARTIAGFPVVTCDIFDTAVMRVLARPEDVHLATGARAVAQGLIRCSPEAFREYRTAAEKALRAEQAVHGAGEVPIATVYHRLQTCGTVTDAVAAAALEFGVERTVCRPIIPVRDALLARATGQRLVFLSDTMLPGDWLATILADCGYGNRCEVICSADAGQTKFAGGLFRYALEHLGCSARDIIHLGDNPVSDIARAREHGIRTLHLAAPRIPPEPEAVARWPCIMRLVHSQRRSRAALTDASRNAAEDSGSALHTPRLQGISLFPLIGFSLFILAEARRRGIRRIYFLARDGHLPLAIVRRLVARSDDSLDLTYLHCSRQALVVPTLLDDLPDLAQQIVDGIMGGRLRAALNVLGIEAEATAAMARAAGLDPEQTVHGKTGRDLVFRLLQANRSDILTALQKRREAALAYLDQSGFLQQGPRMIVDVGWRGSLQRALTRLSNAPPEDIFGCYVGLWAEAISERINPGNAAGYLFSFGHPKWISDIVRQGYIVFELFFSAPDGPVSHYVVQDGRGVPVHAAEAEPGATVRRRTLAAIERRCLAEFDHLDAVLDGAWPAALDPTFAVQDIAPLLTRPSADDVAAINRIPYIHGIDGSLNVPAVNPVPLREWLKHPAKTIARIGNAPWQAGMLRASLPRPIPSVGFPEFRDRFERLRRLVRLGA